MRRFFICGGSIQMISFQKMQILIHIASLQDTLFNYL